MEELTTCTDLEDYVDVLFVVKTCVHFYYIWMVKEHLDFYLTNELVGYLLLVYQFFLDYFHSADETCLFLGYEVYSAVFSLT